MWDLCALKDSVLDRKNNLWDHRDGRSNRIGKKIDRSLFHGFGERDNMMRVLQNVFYAIDLRGVVNAHVDVRSSEHQHVRNIGGQRENACAQRVDAKQAIERAAFVVALVVKNRGEVLRFEVVGCVDHLHDEA